MGNLAVSTLLDWSLQQTCIVTHTWERQIDRISETTQIPAIQMEVRHTATMATMATHEQVDLIFLRTEKSKVLLPSCRQGVSGTKQQHGGTWPSLRGFQIQHCNGKAPCVQRLGLLERIKTGYPNRNTIMVQWESEYIWMIQRWTIILCSQVLNLSPRQNLALSAPSPSPQPSCAPSAGAETTMSFTGGQLLYRGFLHGQGHPRE